MKKAGKYILYNHTERNSAIELLRIIAMAPYYGTWRHSYGDGFFLSGFVFSVYRFWWTCRGMVLRYDYGVLLDLSGLPTQKVDPPDGIMLVL